MNISSRQRMILEILLREEQGITIGEVAEEAHVSARTIHRELAEIEELLKQFQVKLNKRSGIGIQLQGDPEKIEELRLSLINLTTVEYMADERKLLIACTLLQSTEPIKLLSLAYDLKVTTATISHDLDDLEVWLKQYDLTLIRKRGYGVELAGSEAAKRQAMSSLISENLDETELLDIVKETIQNKSLKYVNTVSERLLGLIEKEKLIKVENALRDVERELQYPLADSAYMGLVVHLSLAIERIAKGEKIDFDRSFLQELEDTPEYRMAEQIMKRLEKLFHLEFPIAEVGYITLHLRGAKLRISQENSFSADNVELLTATRRLIKLCEQKLQVNFSEDRSLLQGLLTHMEPAIHRMRQHMVIRNPLLQKIKQDYAPLYRAVAEAVKETFPAFQVPDEEIGYLVLHFGSSLERASRQNVRYRAFIVCSSGIGSSKMLSSRIQKEIPEIDVLKNLSLFEIGNLNREEYDLIVSTVPLPIDADRFVLVSPLLTGDEIYKIKSFLRTLSPPHAVKSQTISARDADQTILALKSLQSYVNHTIELMKGFRFHTVENQSNDLRKTLDLLLDELVQDGIVIDKEPVVTQLMEREKLGGLGIPHTCLALFHGRNGEILKPSFTIYSIQRPITIRSMENKQVQINKILLLLGPKVISKEGLEVLSEISSLLIEDETVDVLKSNQGSIIAAYFAQRLQEFCYKQMKMERSK